MSAKPARRAAVAALFVALFFALGATARFGDNNGQPAISEVTVLLPFTSEHETVSKVLTAKNGCFRWFVSICSHSDSAACTEHRKKTITCVSWRPVLFVLNCFLIKP